MEFWTTLIKVTDAPDRVVPPVFDDVTAKKSLEDNCTHVTGDYWIMEGDTGYLTDQGVKYEEIAVGAVGSLSGLTEKQLIQVCEDSYGVNLTTPNAGRKQDHAQASPEAPIHPELEESRELLCQLCSQEYPTWFAPNELWNAAMRWPDGKEEYEIYQFVCPNCFTKEATKRGVAPRVWMLTSETLSDHRSNEARYDELAALLDGDTYRTRAKISVQEVIDRLQELTPPNPKEPE